MVAVFGVPTALVLLGILHALAAHAKHATTIHDLRVRVFDMRCEYLRKLIAAYKPESMRSSGADMTYSELDVQEDEARQELEGTRRAA